MTHPYKLTDEAEVFTPALVFFPKIIERNIAEVIRMAGGVDRLRPHVKTHKCPEIVKLQLAAGITKHKCATIAEAEMLATAGAPDVLIAYPLVGPNIGRFVTLIQTFPGTKFSAIADHPATIAALDRALEKANITAEVLPDVNVGQDRTGIAVAGLAALYLQIVKSTALKPGGFHVYDGHNSMESHAEREAAVRKQIQPVLEIRKQLESDGLAVPRMVCGGTPSFPIYASFTDIPGLECSPGTFTLYDSGYGAKFDDLRGLTPGAVLVTRVVSKPTPNLITLDLGTKAVASDPPAGKRVTLLDFPTHTPVGHNEEHYIVETAEADKYQPGDVVYAIPTHICPTVALHKDVLVVDEGKVVGTWAIVARDRKLTI
jgi:D-serine deaminase-like pyridoxal phosphate-dependent protein